MKILYVITALAQGGAERVVCDLADAMFEKGNEVKIVYLTGEIFTRPVNQQIELISIGLTNIVSLPISYLKLSNVIRKFSPDIVHAHMVHANLIARLIRVTTPINRLICTAHSSNEGGKLRMILYRVTHHLADITTNVSNTAVHSFELKNAVPKNSMRVIYNGINFNNFNYDSNTRKELFKELSIQCDHKMILSVGRFSKAKNYINLLEAMILLKKYDNTPFKLLIAGDGELRNEIENFIEDSDLSNEVILLGRRDNIPFLMSACDLFVLSSDHEGLPTVLIEALACKAQIVSTNVSGVEEVIGNYGKIVEVRHPKALSEAIVEKLKDNSKNELGFKHVKSIFDIDIISNEWLNIYNEI